MTKENPEKHFLSEKQEGKVNKLEKPKDISKLLVQSLENISQIEPSGKDGRLKKMLLRENISDVMVTLREGDEMDSLNLLVAYRGLEQAKKIWKGMILVLVKQ